MRTDARRSTALVAALALGAAVTASGCGGDEAEPAALAAASAPTPTVAVVVSKRGGGKYRMTAPKTVSAGLVRLTLRVPAGRATHDAQLVRVKGGRTVRQVLRAVGRPDGRIPRWLSPAGGVGTTVGGETNSVMQRLTPGRYVLLDMDQPRGDDVPSYAESGATAVLRVTGRSRPAPLPRTAASVVARDYSFAAGGLQPGRNRITFRNAGREPHHMLAFPLLAGATIDDVRAFLQEEGEPSGPPPIDFSAGRGTAVLDGGSRQVAELDLDAGRYALLCFVTDRAGGPPHAFKGMVGEAVVE